LWVLNASTIGIQTSAFSALIFANEGLSASSTRM
jgi:hypothetical protein